MILKVRLDASYLFESNAQNHAFGHFFMDWSARDGEPIKLNGGFFTLCAILRFVVATTAKAKLGALFLNCKEGMTSRLTLEKLGHPQPKTQVHCNNATAMGKANNTVKQQHSQSMEMRYVWVCDKIAQSAYNVKWYPRKENLADYQSKHHIGMHYQAVRLWYLHTNNSPLVLPWAIRPSTLKGCVGTLPKLPLKNTVRVKILSASRPLRPQRTSSAKTPKNPLPPYHAPLVLMLPQDPVPSPFGGRPRNSRATLLYPSSTLPLKRFARFSLLSMK
jgi:hypothetical protein